MSKTDAIDFPDFETREKIRRQARIDAMFKVVRKTVQLEDLRNSNILKLCTEISWLARSNHPDEDTITIVLAFLQRIESEVKT